MLNTKYYCCCYSFFSIKYTLKHLPSMTSVRKAKATGAPRWGEGFLEEAALSRALQDCELVGKQ